MTLKKCPKCYERINENSRNCPYCGYLFSKVDTSYNNKPDVIEEPVIKNKPELKAYKICSNCNTTNKINASVCRNCTHVLTDAIISENDSSLVEKLTNRYIIKNRILYILMILYLISMMVIPVIVLISTPNSFTAIYFISELFLVVIAVGCAFFPDIMFSINGYHIWIKNPEPTLAYYGHCKFSALIIPLIGNLFLMVK